MEDQWELYGYPSRIIINNGPQFTSREFESQDKDIHHYTTTVYYPQEYGLIEVLNKSIKHGVQTFGGNEGFFDKLGKLFKSYRLTPDSSGSKRADVFLGRETRPEWAPTGNAQQDASAIKRCVTRVMLDSLQTPWGGGEQRPWTSWSLYNQGDFVFVKMPWVHKGLSPWKRPFTVTKVLGSYIFLLSDGEVWNSRNIKRVPPAQSGHEEFLDDDGPLRRLQQPQDAVAEPVKPVQRSTCNRNQTNFYGRS
ncbi:MAG: transposase family protein [Gammaproteobacteria bacterium]|nr:transposase family protein [Gammaproteobacteria bacterium]